jgi:ABC-2 type transport system permease protein
MNRVDSAPQTGVPGAGREAAAAGSPPQPALDAVRRRLPRQAAVSAVGFRTLLAKEVLRFWKVSFQTVAAPVLTGVLYLLVFGHVLEDRVQVFPGVSYTAFLIPGLVMMSLLQNAFANSSSSLIQSKITGNLVFVLLPPISTREFFLAYVLASATRGLVVGCGVFAVTVWFAPLSFKAPLWIVAFALLGAALLGVLGLIAGIVSDKFDQLAAFQNFIIMPATFLSGVFYSVHGLPPFWQAVSHLNPFFYMIDGFRYGFYAQSDASPWLSFGIVAAALAAASAVALAMLGRGYKIRG